MSYLLGFLTRPHLEAIPVLALLRSQVECTQAVDHIVGQDEVGGVAAVLGTALVDGAGNHGAQFDALFWCVAHSLFSLAASCAAYAGSCSMART